jgi:hypothetical protein
MEKLRGRIKAVAPVGEIHSGMKMVTFRNEKWEIVTINNPPTITPYCFIEGETQVLHKDELKVLVVCHIVSSLDKLGVKNVLLEESVWQTSIDNGAVDNSTIIVMFTIENKYFSYIPTTTGQELTGYKEVAKISGALFEEVIDKKIQYDRLFIQEIINDLEKNGYRPGDKNQSKAFQMLVDWSAELRENSHSNGKTKKLHTELVGKENY